MRGSLHAGGAEPALCTHALAELEQQVEELLNKLDRLREERDGYKAISEEMMRHREIVRWGTFRIEDKPIVHVCPLDAGPDTTTHALRSDCPCEPYVKLEGKDGYIVIHNREH